MLFAGAFTTTLPQALPAPSMWKSPLRAVHVPSLLNTVSASLAPYSDRLYRISGVEKPMESSLKTLRAKLLCFRPALRAPPLLVLFIFLREKKDKSFFRMRGCEDAETRGPVAIPKPINAFRIIPRTYPSYLTL